MKKKSLLLIALTLIICLITCLFTGCTESERVSYNISQEADNFNVFRRVVVVNTMTDKILFELDGFFSIESDNEDNQLEITCQTGPKTFQKHFVGLGTMVAYTIEDLEGADVDPYHYEIHYLPEGNVVNFKFKKSS